MNNDSKESNELVCDIPTPRVVSLGNALAMATQASSSLSMRVWSADLEGPAEGRCEGLVVGATGKLDGFPKIVGAAEGSCVGVTVEDKEVKVKEGQGRS